MRAAPRRKRGLAAIAVLCAAGASAPCAYAAKLGGAYFVDDYDIGSVGSCEVESWGSSAANGDKVLVFSPACVFDLGRPVELGVNLVQNRSDGAWDSIAAATAKTVLFNPQGGLPGIGIAGAITYDVRTGSWDGLILNVPFTWDFGKSVRLNVNVGAQYDASDRQLFGLAGVGASWNFLPKWSVIGETFAAVGPGQANPRWQSGVRYSPGKDVDCDVIYGRNITGERSHWLTLALTMRIGEKGE